MSRTARFSSESPSDCTVLPSLARLQSRHAGGPFDCERGVIITILIGPAYHQCEDFSSACGSPTGHGPPGRSRTAEDRRTACRSRWRKSAINDPLSPSLAVLCRDSRPETRERFRLSRSTRDRTAGSTDRQRSRDPLYPRYSDSTPVSRQISYFEIGSLPLLR